MSWQSVLLSVALLGLAACTGDFEDINRNPNQVTEEQMDALNYKTGTKFKSLQSLVIPVQEHMYQFNESLSGGPFGGYIGATVDTWQTKFETYNPSADWRKWPFANVITETYTPYKCCLLYTSVCDIVARQQRTQKKSPGTECPVVKADLLVREAQNCLLYTSTEPPSYDTAPYRRCASTFHPPSRSSPSTVHRSTPCRQRPP